MDIKEKQRLVGLDPREYEHPLDREALDKLEAIPGAKALFIKINEEWLEKLMYIRNVGTNIILTKDNSPRIIKILNEASRILDLDAVPNIYLYGEFGGDIKASTQGSYEPHIALSRRAVVELDDLELLVLIGRELGRIKSGHVLYRTIAEYLADSLVEVISSLTLGLGSIPAKTIEYALRYWYRMSEFTADRAGLLVSQDINAFIRLQLRQSGLPKDSNMSLFQNSFIEQAQSFKDFDYKNVNKFIKLLSTANEVEPYPVIRASELIKWGKSHQYKSILARENMNIVTKISSESKFCPNCSTTLSKGDKFCGGCGSEIS